jgi:hypothetical protein
VGYSNPQRASRPIQSRPVQPNTSPRPHPVGESQHDRRLEPVPGRGVQELPRLVDSERPALLGSDARCNRQTGYVAAHDALADSLPVRPAQHGSHDPDTVGAVTGIPFRLPQPVKISDGQLGQPLAPQAPE